MTWSIDGFVTIWALVAAPLTAAAAAWWSRKVARDEREARVREERDRIYREHRRAQALRRLEQRYEIFAELERCAVRVRWLDPADINTPAGTETFAPYLDASSRAGMTGTAGIEERDAAFTTSLMVRAGAIGTPREDEAREGVLSAHAQLSVVLRNEIKRLENELDARFDPADAG